MHFVAVFLSVMHWSSSQVCTLLHQSSIKTCVKVLKQEMPGIVTCLLNAAGISTACWIWSRSPGVPVNRPCSRWLCQLWECYRNLSKGDLRNDWEEVLGIKLRRNDKVKTMNAKHTTVNARGQCMVVNPALLFNRITCVLNKGSEMSGFFAYQLAS